MVFVHWGLWECEQQFLHEELEYLDAVLQSNGTCWHIQGRRKKGREIKVAGKQPCAIFKSLKILKLLHESNMRQCNLFHYGHHDYNTTACMFICTTE